MQLKVLFAIVFTAFFLCGSNNSYESKRSNFRYDGMRTTGKATKTMCMDWSSTLRAKKKSCFLRPDTGPCRADILQWYFDVKQKKCYRFFWGGCQGNGNRFETRKDCINYCFLNSTAPLSNIPAFCSLPFDYGTCYGHYYRWAWDTIGKICKRRLYSGCGGNQNNFETQNECMSTCLNPPSNTLLRLKERLHTTCIPFDVNNLQ